MVAVLIIFAAVAAALGYRVIAAVPPMLHTPLMSGMNALSGITVLGSLVVYATASTTPLKLIAGAAVILAMLNVAGGYWVTDRMLGFFKGKASSSEKEKP